MPKLRIDGYVAERIFNTPLLLEENKAKVIANYLEQRFMGDGITLDLGERTTPDNSEDFQIVEGVAIIPIIGTLVHRGGWMDAASGLLSYQVLRDQLISAAENPNVKSILLEIDSGGGEVQGNFELASLIRQINDEFKPVVAIANGSAFSGAFSLGVSAGEFFVTETGGVGSVGVIIQHVDVSKNNEMRGIKITNIVAGERKAELSPDFPLSKEGKDMLQKEVNRIGDMFVKLVADMRGISENSVRATEASLLFGMESVSIGFVDGIISFDSLLQSMIDMNSNRTVGGIKQRIEEMKMFKKKAAEEKPEAKAEQEVEAAKDEVAVEEETSEQEVEVAEEEKTQEVDQVARAAEIATLCANAGMASQAADYIKSGLTVEEIAGKIDTKKQIEKICTLAGKKDAAAAYIAANKTVKQVQDDLISKMSEEQMDISNKQEAEAVNKEVSDAKKNVIQQDIERRQQAKLKQKGDK